MGFLSVQMGVWSANGGLGGGGSDGGGSRLLWDSLRPVWTGSVQTADLRVEAWRPVPRGGLGGGGPAAGSGGPEGPTLVRERTPGLGLWGFSPLANPRLMVAP